MPFLPIDQFNLAAPWQALSPAATPSTQLVIAAVGEAHPMAESSGALAVTFSGASLGHRMRRSFGPVDLRSFDRLTFWFRSETEMNGLSTDPLQLRLRLGSAGLTLDAGGNSWARYLAGENGRNWNFATVSLTDLPVAIANAATQIEFQVAATDGASHRVTFDALAAAQPGLVADVDTALLASFNNTLSIGGNPVPARLSPQTTTRPYISITQFGARRAFDRDPMGHARKERDDLGLLIWPEPKAWDLSYRLDPQADSRSEQATIIDFLTARLANRWLPIGNRAYRVEKDDFRAEDDEALPLPPLRYVVSAYAETGTPVRAVPATTTTLNIDQQAQGA